MGDADRRPSLAVEHDAEGVVGRGDGLGGDDTTQAVASLAARRRVQHEVVSRLHDDVSSSAGVSGVTLS